MILTLGNLDCLAARDHAFDRRACEMFDGEAVHDHQEALALPVDPVQAARIARGQGCTARPRP